MKDNFFQKQAISLQRVPIHLKMHIYTNKGNHFDFEVIVVIFMEQYSREGLSKTPFKKQLIIPFYLQPISFADVLSFGFQNHVL